MLYFSEHFACWEIFLNFLSSVDFFKTYFRKIISESNSLDPDQDRCLIGPDLGPSCWARLSADH